MGLPTAPSPIGNPLGSGNLSAAWALPLPDDSGEWGADLRGVMTTPAGRIMSAEATPQLIGFGFIVFNDPNSRHVAASIGLEGRSGMVKAYRLDGSSWKEL